MTKVPLSELHRVFMIMESLSAMRKKDQEEIEQEVEGEKEEKRSNNNAHVHGWDDYGRENANGLSHVKCDVNEYRRLNYGPHAMCSMLPICASLRASRHSLCCSQWSHRC